MTGRNKRQGRQVKKQKQPVRSVPALDDESAWTNVFQGDYLLDFPSPSKLSSGEDDGYVTIDGVSCNCNSCYLRAGLEVKIQEDLSKIRTGKPQLDNNVPSAKLLLSKLNLPPCEKAGQNDKTVDDKKAPPAVTLSKAPREEDLQPIPRPQKPPLSNAKSAIPVSPAIDAQIREQQKQKDSDGASRDESKASSNAEQQRKSPSTGKPRKKGLGCSYNCCTEKCQIKAVDTSLMKSPSSYMQTVPQAVIDSEIDLNKDFFVYCIIDYLQQERKNLFREYVTCKNKRNRIISRSRQISKRQEKTQDQEEAESETKTESRREGDQLTCTCEECLKKRDDITKSLIEMLGRDCIIDAKQPSTDCAIASDSSDPKSAESSVKPASSSGEGAENSITEAELAEKVERVKALVDVFGRRSEMEACYDIQLLDLAKKFIKIIVIEEYTYEEERLYNEWSAKYAALENKRADIKNRIEKCVKVMQWAGENEEYMLESASDGERELLHSVMMQEQQLQEALAELPPEPLPQPDYGALVNLHHVHQRVEVRAKEVMDKLIAEFRLKHIKQALGTWNPSDLYHTIDSC